jgi:hypothetical protein
MDVSGANGTQRRAATLNPYRHVSTGERTMPFRFSKKTAAIALALCVALPASATVASAKVCKPNSVSKSGGKKWTNISARVSARLAWSNKVRKDRGLAWAAYFMASNKGYNCRRVKAKWRCTAYGRPCRAGN